MIPTEQAKLNGIRRSTTYMGPGTRRMCGSAVRLLSHNVALLPSWWYRLTRLAFVDSRTNLTEIDQCAEAALAQQHQSVQSCPRPWLLRTQLQAARSFPARPRAALSGAAPAKCTDSAGTLSFAEISRVIEAGARRGSRFGGSSQDRHVRWRQLGVIRRCRDAQNEAPPTPTPTASVEPWYRGRVSRLCRRRRGQCLDRGGGRVIYQRWNTLLGGALAIQDQCVWTPCSAPVVPVGYLAATTVFDGCPFFIPEGGGYPTTPSHTRALCCPTNPFPICQERGHARDYGCTRGTCNNDEVVVAQTRSLWVGQQWCAWGDLNNLLPGQLLPW